MKLFSLLLNFMLILGIFIFGSFILSYLWVGVIDEGSNFFNYLQSRTNSFTYDYYANKYHDDELVQQTLYLCSVFEGKDQINCVVRQFNHLFDYRDHNETVRSPEDMHKNGGVCRDAVVFYSTIFNQLGYNVRYQYPFSFHVYIEVSKDMGEYWLYCNIDQNNYDCAEIV